MTIHTGREIGGENVFMEGPSMYDGRRGWENGGMEFRIKQELHAVKKILAAEYG